MLSYIYSLLMHSIYIYVCVCVCVCIHTHTYVRSSSRPLCGVPFNIKRPRRVTVCKILRNTRYPYHLDYPATNEVRMTLLFIPFLSFYTEHASPIEQAIRTLLLCSLEITKLRNSSPPTQRVCFSKTNVKFVQLSPIYKKQDLVEGVVHAGLFSETRVTSNESR